MPALGTGTGTAFQQGVDGSKPAAAPGNTGWYYLSTDLNGGTLFQSTGSAWTQVTTGVTAVKPNGLTGAVAASRYAGGTTSGAPASGTFAVGDLVVDQTGVVWICTGAGTPGTWVSAAGSGVTSLTGTANRVTVSASNGAVTLSGPQDLATSSSPTFKSVALGGLTGATAASRIAGATASGAPASGTFAVGDLVVDQTGKVWICTGAGTPGTWVQVGGSSGALAELADVVIAGSVTTTISFASISGSYTSLLIMLTCRADEATTADNMKARFNNDSGTSYDGQYVEVITGQTITRNMNTTSMQVAEVVCASAPANSAWNGYLWVPNYTDTTFHKGLQAQGGGEYSTNSYDQSTGGAGHWRSTSAITQIDLIAPASSHWVAGTHARLFGIN